MPAAPPLLNLIRPMLSRVPALLLIGAAAATPAATPAAAPAATTAAAGGELAPRPLSVLPADLQGLARALESHGFRVRIALPPQRQSYGLFESRSRTLWISPLSFELGIGRQTFLHEATHAVQSCPNGVLRPIGWRFTLDPAVGRGISALLTTGYAHGNWAVEQEAFALQGQPDAVPRLLAAIKQRCRSGSAPAANRANGERRPVAPR